jgi:hypothetical protein
MAIVKKKKLRDEYTVINIRALKNETQCHQQAHTRPIASLTQIPPQVIRYVLENDAHSAQSLGHSLEQYI